MCEHRALGGQPTDQVAAAAAVLFGFRDSGSLPFTIKSCASERIVHAHNGHHVLVQFSGKEEWCGDVAPRKGCGRFVACIVPPHAHVEL